VDVNIITVDGHMCCLQSKSYQRLMAFNFSREKVHSSRVCRIISTTKSFRGKEVENLKGINSDFEKELGQMILLIQSTMVKP
jgi:hypothetical protein